MMHMKKVQLIYILSMLLFPVTAFPQDKPFLTDYTGDAVVELYAFGDSTTFGVGDGIPPGVFYEEVPHTSRAGGYPMRLQKLLGVKVENGGVPGEEFIEQGIFRLPGVLSSRNPDIILLLEGVNDAVKQRTRGEFSRTLQRAINVSLARGEQPLIMTPPAPCCSRTALAVYTESYSEAVRELAAINGIRMVDLERAWNSTCQGGQCNLYNVPEGLHPNTRGYDVMSQTIAASLLDIDIFSVGGAALLEAALALPPGSIIVQPDGGVTQ